QDQMDLEIHRVVLRINLAGPLQRLRLLLCRRHTGQRRCNGCAPHMFPNKSSAALLPCADNRNYIFPLYGYSSCNTPCDMGSRSYRSASRGMPPDQRERVRLHPVCTMHRMIMKPHMMDLNNAHRFDASTS